MSRNEFNILIQGYLIQIYSQKVLLVDFRRLQSHSLSRVIFTQNQIENQ